MLEDEPELGLRRPGSRLPVRMKNGTPAQRQFSISSRSAAYVSVVESGATPSIVEVAVVLAAHVVRRVGLGDRAEQRRPARP